MILLDTCALLWLAGDQARLSASAKELITAHADALFVSAASAWEIGLKHRKGRLTLPLPAQRWYARATELHGLREIPIDGGLALASTALPDLHRDPADRLIVATAQRHGLTVLTPDPLVGAYPDTPTAW